MTNTWWRLGVTIPMTNEEIAILKSGDYPAIVQLLKKKWITGECKLDGESYMPEDEDGMYSEVDIIF